jgi:hypothetical protein
LFYSKVAREGRGENEAVPARSKVHINLSKILREKVVGQIGMCQMRHKNGKPNLTPWQSEETWRGRK